MSTIAFLNIAMHGHINPTLPVIAELVRRGHSVTYHTSPAFSQEIEATGATVCLYPGATDRSPIRLCRSRCWTGLRAPPWVCCPLCFPICVASGPT